MGILLMAVAIVVVVCVCKKMNEDQIEREERKEREERENYNYNSRRSETMSNNLPVLTNLNTRSIFPTPHDYFPIITTSPETELTRFSPKLGANVLLKQSLDLTLSNLANSSVATEFARQGRGTYAAARRRKILLGLGGEISEFIIKPID